MAVHLAARKIQVADENLDLMPGKLICVVKQTRLIIRINYHLRKGLNLIYKDKGSGVVLINFLVLLEHKHPQKANLYCH